MKLFFKSKDGGNESNVTGYWLIEAKSLFSIVLLRFDKGSREAYHNHAFNAVSWVVSGAMVEHLKPEEGGKIPAIILAPSFMLVFTSRERMHRVFGVADNTWVVSFRGPWTKTWKEWFHKEDKEITLTDGRKVVE